MGKLQHFPYDKIHQRMESNGKKDLYYGKTMGTNFPDSPRTVDFVAFSHTMENFMKKPKYFSCDEVYQKMEI